MALSKQERLFTLLKLLNEGEEKVSRQEVTAFFKALAEHVKGLEPKLAKRLDDKFSSSLSRISSAQQSVNQALKSAKEVGDEQARKDLASVKRELNKVREAILDFATTDDVIGFVERMIEQIPAETPERIKLKLESLDGDERLSMEAIDGLESKLESFDKRITEANSRVMSSGTSNARIALAFKEILKTEEPVGAINGSNKVYTVSQPIFAILSFSLNGETIAELPNYTINARSITFSTALPAAYANKDFEVKYI